MNKNNPMDESAGRLPEGDGEPDGGLWPLAILVVVALAMGFDLATDTRAGASVGHVAIEALVLVVSGGGALILWRRMQKARRALGRLGRDLHSAHAEAARWRAEAESALRGLGAAIEQQFERWQLSTAEKEVALLLLKGLSLKEIAAVRSTAERTVRQQALAIYRKADLAGRAELSAFFLEDLLLPPAPANAHRE